MNKLQLEGLVKAGAFDTFDIERGKIFNSVPKIIQYIKNANDDKTNNQNSLFAESERININFDFYLHSLDAKRTFS